MKNENITLIGMPGSGKSTVGVLLAKRMGYKFLDTDLLIQEREGKRLFEIMRDSGNEYFLKVENEVNSSVDTKRTVIATGGSAVFGKDAMEHFKSIGKIVYIRVPCEVLKERIKDYSTRGILMREGQSFEDIYAERSPLYEKYADVIVDTSSDGVFENCLRLERALEDLRKWKR